MAGRRPRPSALRLIEGNPGKRNLAKQLAREPVAEVGATMPAGLSAAARAHWKIVAAQLTDARILTRLDAVALSQYCEVFAQWRDATDKVAEFGASVETGQGGLKLSPYWAAFIQASGELRRMLIEFGMTPSARARVAAIGKKADDADPFETFE